MKQEVLDGIIVSKNLREAVVNSRYKSDGGYPMKWIEIKDDSKRWWLQLRFSIEPSRRQKMAVIIYLTKNARALRGMG